VGPNQTLFAIFLGLYFLECFTWVKPHEQLFVQGLWGAFRRRLGGLQFKPLLPSGASLLVAFEAASLDQPPLPGAVEAVQAKVQAYQHKATWLNLSGLTLIVSVAGLLLLLSWNTYNFSWLIRFSIFAGLIVIAHFSNVFLLWLFWTQLHADTKGRRAAVLIASVSPWASSRAADLLGRPVLRGAHPVAAAEALLEAQDKQALAAELLLRALHPKAGEGVDTQAWQAWLKSRGYDLKKLAARPARSQSNSRSYCPRCLAQYTHAEGLCRDCGIVLTVFSST
jgi:hypothetical protein